MNKKEKIGWPLIITLSLIPGVLWFFSPHSGSRFSSTTILGSIGQIAGLIGVTMFAMTFILSLKLKIFEKYLNKIYEKHHLIGQTALILLLIHPITLAIQYTGSLRDSFNFIFSSSDWTLNFGKIALGLMFSLIILTLSLMPKYNIWKWTNKFLGIALFFGALHAWMIPSDISRNILLRTYVFFFVFSGIIAFLYKHIFRKLLYP